MAISHIKVYGGVTHKAARGTRFRQKMAVVSCEVPLAWDISRNLARIYHALSARDKDEENEIVIENI
jgi:hypothetical protein